MMLCAKDGPPKLVPACAYALTGVGCVTRVYTEVAVFELASAEGDVVVRTFGTTFDELASRLSVGLQDGTRAVG